MPGIAGFITTDPDQPAAGPRLSKVLRDMGRYPVYVQGVLTLPEHGAFIGWSVLRDSNGSIVPIHSPGDDVTLVFCGGEFPRSVATNVMAIQQHLTGLLGSHRGFPDTLLRELNGWFAGS